MSNTALLKVLEIFKTNSQNHKAVYTADYGTLIQLLERPKVNYTDVYILYNSSTITENEINYNISLVVSDLMRSDSSNIANIWNATHKIGEEIIYYTNNENRKFLSVDLTNISVTPFFNGRVDGVAGTTFTFNVNVFNSQSGCELPIVSPIIPVQPCTPPVEPRILPVEGSYRTDLQQISFESDQNFVGFYYTVDGSTPTLNSTLYSGPFTITEQGTITVKVIAVGYNELSSDVVSSTYDFTFPQAQAPTISPNNGSYTQPLSITMDSSQDLPIYYTTDGSTPDENSTLYTGAFQLSAGTFNVKAIVIADQYNPSTITERTYQINAVNTLALAVHTGGAYLSTDENLVNWNSLNIPNVLGQYNSIDASRVGSIFGKYIYVATGGGGSTPRIHKSEDFGATWTVIQENLATQVICSEDGRYVYTWGFNANIYYSSDYGATFNTNNFGFATGRLSCSPNGRYIYATTSVLRNLFISSDFGVNYINVPGTPSVASVDPVAASRDGSTYFSAQFANSPNGRFNKWTNFGANRSEFYLDANNVSYVYTRIDTDPTATTVITARGSDAAINTGRVFINTTGGNQTGWTEVAPTGTATDLEWRDVATNGSKFIAANRTRIYASLNGTTWFETRPDGNNNRFWMDAHLYAI